MTPIVEDRKPLPRGTFVRIAERLGVTRQSVRDVAIGAKRSARIERELRRERRKEERRASRAGASV